MSLLWNICTLSVKGCKFKTTLEHKQETGTGILSTALSCSSATLLETPASTQCGRLAERWAHRSTAVPSAALRLSSDPNHPASLFAEASRVSCPAAPRTLSEMKWWTLDQLVWLWDSPRIETGKNHPHGKRLLPLHPPECKPLARPSHSVSHQLRWSRTHHVVPGGFHGGTPCAVQEQHPGCRTKLPLRAWCHGSRGSQRGTGSRQIDATPPHQVPELRCPSSLHVQKSKKDSLGVLAIFNANHFKQLD